MANLKTNLEFNLEMEELTTNDKAHPDTWNPRYEQLLSNDVKNSNYENLNNIPKINGKELMGDKMFKDLGLEDIEGNAGTATKLKNTVQIGGVEFDGSASIGYYAECSSSSGASSKSVPIQGFVLETGARITVKFLNGNGVDNPSLNVNKTGAKPIYYRGLAASRECLKANKFYEFLYDGSCWQLLSSESNFACSQTGQEWNLNNMLEGGLFVIYGPLSTSTGFPYTPSSSVLIVFTLPNNFVKHILMKFSSNDIYTRYSTYTIGTGVVWSGWEKISTLVI